MQYDTAFSSTRQSALIAREKHIYISSNSRSSFLDFFTFSRDFYRVFIQYMFSQYFEV